MTKAREEMPLCFGTSKIDQDAKAPMTVWSGINQTMGMKYVWQNFWIIQYPKDLWDY